MSRFPDFRPLWLCLIRGAALCIAVGVAGCTSLQRSAHMYSSKAFPAQTFQYADGGNSLYYSFLIGEVAEPDTVVFFYGGSGCPSWKSVMPQYVDGLRLDSRVYALNKRLVSDRSTGMLGCDEGFDAVNLPEQWVLDYTEFVTGTLRAIRRQPRAVVLVGVSEGALQAGHVAARLPAVTHLALIGSGGYSMRKSLQALRQKGAISFDVDAGAKLIGEDPQSLNKTWYGNPYRWWSSVLDFDPTLDLLTLNIPILVGVGENDTNMPVESARYLAERFTQAGKRNLVMKIYPGADHRLQAGNKSYRHEFFQKLGQMIGRTD